MPLVRVDIPEGASNAVKGRLRQAKWDAIEAALARVDRGVRLAVSHQSSVFSESEADDR